MTNLFLELSNQIEQDPDEERILRKKEEKEEKRVKVYGVVGHTYNRKRDGSNKDGREK